MTTTQARYRDPSLPIEQRVADLLARMTLDEKIAQLGSMWSFELFRSETELDPALLRVRLGSGIGQISRVAGATNLDAAGAAAAGNEIQRFLVEETRLGIPAILHEETLHGLLARGAISFQQSIGAAAAFDPE
ncbi:MAG TPA: glycoside hydrolase family 3 N-terminal domain-containing protein, partial [Candidatus Limnocylindrales bacterium]